MADSSLIPLKAAPTDLPLRKSLTCMADGLPLSYRQIGGKSQVVGLRGSRLRGSGLRRRYTKNWPAFLPANVRSGGGYCMRTLRLRCCNSDGGNPNLARKRLEKVGAL